ncbi:hypothetical protein [Geodermatophilus arenarius]|uniref:Uncharacterized protein n=1 Tax=Geodermatophilus arenarius TaxID=1137990 RepID=A0ABV9LHR0_9ACTN
MTHERARVAHATRFHGPDAPQTALARRDLRAANLEAAIRRAVAEAPPLTGQQKARLRALLSPAAGTAARQQAARLDGDE